MAEYRKAVEDCLENREKLVNTINEVDYYLYESPDRNITINDLFLENEDLGMRCASSLVKQVRYQYELLKHIPHNGDFQMLLDEFTVDSGCLKYLISTHDVILSGLKVPEAHTNVHISFTRTGIPVEPINCQTLVDFTDKLLELIVKKLQINQADCKSDSCDCKHCTFCTLLDESGLNKEEISSLLKNFRSNVEQTPFNTDDKTDPTNFQDFGGRREPNVDVDISFEYSWERFKETILDNYEYLKEYYKKNVGSLTMQSPIVIIYRDIGEIFRVKHCSSIPEARLKACSLEDISKKTFPVVLITTTDYQFPNTPSRKRMIQKFSDSSKVGEEKPPSVTGMISPPGQPGPDDESSEFPTLFYLDTGADTGSVGYNYHVIKHFTCTVERINGSLEPAILCNFTSAMITAEEIQVFDVDQNPNWNAIGLSVLKNYRIYLDIKNDRIEIGRHEDVEVKDSEESFQVVFKKDVPSPFPSSNADAI